MEAVLTDVQILESWMAGQNSCKWLEVSITKAIVLHRQLLELLVLRDDAYHALQ